ncbi:glycosyltransferase [Microbacterium sp. CH1]|uniref:glycosyltransferase n=1 Tax=Microbacterium sp. CH1 TaxID=1770208 RepID=UPI0012F84F82|nr:glycosyltransferase family 2 protein [Microbacterium sp. CH1]
MKWSGPGLRRPPSARRQYRSARTERRIWFSALAGLAITAIMVGPTWAVGVAFAVVSFIFIVALVRTLTISFTAGRAMMHRPSDGPPAARRTISVLVACHNEDRVIDDLMGHLRATDYPSHLLQVIVVDDNSSDATLSHLRRWEARWPELTVLARGAGASGGKSGALNAALAKATGEIIVVFDADHRPDRRCLRYLAAAFDDETVAAAQGRCVVHNTGDSIISELVALDYLGGFIVNERGRTAYAGAPSYGGSNCAVRRDVLVEMGGWNVMSVTEDTDITMRIYLAGARIAYEPRAVDYEQAVSGLWAYMRQRHRWALGHQQVFRDYLAAMIRTRSVRGVQKAELLFYLAIYHLPVICTVGLALISVAGLFGVTGPVAPSVLVGLWPLLVWGPLIPVGIALVAARAPLRRFLIAPLLLLLVVLGAAIVTTAWARGLFGRRYSWAKTARAAQPEAEAIELSDDVPVLPEGSLQEARGERIIAPPRRALPRRKLRPSFRTVGVTVLTAAVGCLVYVVCELWVRRLETSAVGAVLRLGSLRAEAEGDRLWLYDRDSTLYLLITDIGCSIAPVLLGALLVCAAMRSLAPTWSLVLAAAASAAFAFCANVIRIAALAVLANVASFDAMRVVHDTVASAFALAAVMAAFIVLVAIPARAARIHVDG